MSLLTVFLFGVIIYLFYAYSDRKKIYLSLFVLTSIIELFWMGGSIMHYGSLFLSNHTTLCEYITFFYGFYLLRKEKLHIESTLFKWAAVVGIIPLLGCAYEIFFPFDGYVAPGIEYYDLFFSGKIYSMIPAKIDYYVFFRLYIKILFFIQNVLIIRSITDYEDLKWMIEKLVFVLKGFIIFGFSEYVFRNILGLSELKEQAVTFFLGMDASGYEIQIRNNAYALNGLSREASHYVCSLFMVASVFIVDIKRKYNENILEFRDVLWGMLVIPLLLLTGGFSSLWALACVALLSLIIFMNVGCASFIKILKWIILFLILLVLGWKIVFWLSNDTSSYFGTRMYLTLFVLENLWDGNYMLSAYDSSLPRVMSIIDSIKNLIDRPVVGLGLGVQLAHSGLATFLTGVGVLGYLAWMKLLTCGVDSKKYDLAAMFLIYTIGLIFMGFIENYMQCIAVLLAELTALYMRKEKEKIN